MINKIRTLLDVQIRLEQRKLDNGTVVEAESFSKGNEIFIKTDDEKVAMPIGEYILDDGQVLLVKEVGLIADLTVQSKEDEDLRDDGEEAAVDDWAGMEKRIKNLEDAVADLKKDKEPRSEDVKDEKDIEVDAETEKQVKSRTVKEEFSEPDVQPIKHSPEGNFKKETQFQFSQKRPKSVLDTVMEQIINN